MEKNCKRCPNGSFVPFDKTPGTSSQDCKSCPLGNKELVQHIACKANFLGLAEFEYVKGMH